MYGPWQRVLGDLIVGYINDEDLETGSRGAIAVAIASDEHYITGLKAGIASTARRS